MTTEDNTPDSDTIARMTKPSDDKTYRPKPSSLKILEAVCEYGALTSLQLSNLLGYKFTYKEGKLSCHRGCGTPITELHRNHYLKRLQRIYPMGTGKAYYLYTLDTKGRKALAALWDCKVSEVRCAPIDDNKEHFLLINGFRTDLARAVADSPLGAEIITDVDEATIRHESAIVIPDYYFHLATQEPQPHHFHGFLEIDRGKEVGKTKKVHGVDWEKKVLNYIEYRRRDKVLSLCDERYGTNKVTTLTVTTSDTRLQNLKRITEDAGGKHRFWFTTYDRLNAQSFFTEDIWAIATKPGWYNFFKNTENE